MHKPSSTQKMSPQYSNMPKSGFMWKHECGGGGHIFKKLSLAPISKRIPLIKSHRILPLHLLYVKLPYNFLLWILLVFLLRWVLILKQPWNMNTWRCWLCLKRKQNPPNWIQIEGCTFSYHCEEPRASAVLIITLTPETGGPVILETADIWSADSSCALS